MEIKNRQTALLILSNKIKHLYEETNYYNQSVRDKYLKEVRALAEEWDIPFCWELHEMVLDNKRFEDNWDSSGCSFGEETYSWDSSSANC